jgi:hypothetical protein
MQQILYVCNFVPTASPITTVPPQFTAEAYTTRTGRPCSALSFQDIASGSLPESLVASRPLHPEPEPEQERGTPGQGPTGADGDEDMEPDPAPFPIMDIVICSFALHLLEDSSQLWALLSELSWKATWLIVLEPHKKPEVSPSSVFLALRFSFRKRVDQGGLGLDAMELSRMER